MTLPSKVLGDNVTPRILSADEFEMLALMGRTPAGDLIVGEGGAERVLAHAKRLATEQLKASRYPEPESAEPGTTLERSWEGFAEERAGMAADAPLAFARQAFYAGAQSFCAVMGAALADESSDEESTRQVDAVYVELAAAIKELKL
jgi:hypothetical protein